MKEQIPIYSDAASWSSAQLLHSCVIQNELTSSSGLSTCSSQSLHWEPFYSSFGVIGPLEILATVLTGMARRYPCLWHSCGSLWFQVFLLSPKTLAMNQGRKNVTLKFGAFFFLFWFVLFCFWFCFHFIFQASIHFYVALFSKPLPALQKVVL